MNKKKVNSVADENFKQKQATKKKMQLIMQKINEELQTLEVEWLHLRGLVNENNSTVSAKTKDLEPVNETNKFDDIDVINSENFSLTPLENMSPKEYCKEENDSSENEN